MSGILKDIEQRKERQGTSEAPWQTCLTPTCSRPASQVHTPSCSELYEARTHTSQEMRPSLAQNTCVVPSSLKNVAMLDNIGSAILPRRRLKGQSTWRLRHNKSIYKGETIGMQHFPLKVPLVRRMKKGNPSAAPTAPLSSLTIDTSGFAPVKSQTSAGCRDLLKLPGPARR